MPRSRRPLRSVCWLLLLLARPLDAATAARGIVAAEHELAVKAGVAMFERGGNAVDAAVATVFATGVVNPSSCGIGGGGFALIHDGKSRQDHVVDFRETAPHAATADMYLHDGKVVPGLSLRGGLAVAVPGEIKGLARVLRDFGTLSLATVLSPAIRYAQDGFPVGPHLAAELAANAEEIRRRPALAAVYLKADGTSYAQGETLVQRDLASTLRAVAEGGPRAFYEGTIAERLVRAAAAEGGIVDAADLRSYRERMRKPLRTEYRGLAVLGVPPPSSGGGVVLEILNVLDGYDLRSAGPKSAFGLHRIAQAESVAFRDRARYYGDPDFVEVPMARLLSAEHAEELRREIAAAGPAGNEALPERGGTAHTSALDAHGNAAAITSTINTAFGSMVLAPGTGVVLNNEMDDFSAAPGVPNVYGLVGNAANAIAAGKRPLSSMSPTLVLRDGAPLLAIGGSGGPRIITATVQTLVNVVDYGMDLDAAVSAPRIHEQGIPPPLFVEPALDAATVAGLRKLGHDVVEARDLGAVGAVMRTDGGLVGVGDARKGGAAAGW
ncbi:MAG TPA: gamma-glutamyltransferase [Candidatus Binatia bacterium]|nr:gamma-glutamyltransferase [Candidatus Binatia bacterium]